LTDLVSVPFTRWRKPAFFLPQPGYLLEPKKSLRRRAAQASAWDLSVVCAFHLLFHGLLLLLRAFRCHFLGFLNFHGYIAVFLDGRFLKCVILAFQVGQLDMLVMSGDKEKGRPENNQPHAHGHRVIGCLLVLCSRYFVDFARNPHQLRADLLAGKILILNGGNIGCLNAVGVIGAGGDGEAYGKNRQIFLHDKYLSSLKDLNK
jgi:hypothetical protein